MYKVTWRDIHTITSHGNMWLNKEEALQGAKNHFESLMITYGEILDNNKDYITIASTVQPPFLGDPNPCYSDISMIPKAIIVNITKLT